MKKVVGWPLSVGVATIIASQGNPPIMLTLHVIFSMFFVSSCVYLYNDVCDLEMDKLNPLKQDRPLVKGMVSSEDAMKIVYINGILGLILVPFVGLETAAIILIYFIIFIMYSYPPIYLKGRFPFKELVIAGGGVICTLIGSSLVGNLSSAVIFFGVTTFFFTYLSMPVFADSRDVNEDEIYGVKTLSMVISWRNRVMMFTGFVFLLMIFTPLTWASFNLNIIFPVLVVGACLLFLRYMFPLLAGLEETKFNRAAKALHAFWIIIFIAFVFGSIHFS